MSRISRTDQIEAYLREQVLPGLSVGAEMPTIATLCDRFDVRGVQTVRNAVAPLVAEGWVETRMAPTRRWVVRTAMPVAGQADAHTATSALFAELAAHLESTAGVLRRLAAATA